MCCDLVRIGRDFCFGSGREGNLAMLEAAGARAGFAVHGVDDVKIRGIRVSSSIVRNAIIHGAGPNRPSSPWSSASVTSPTSPISWASASCG